MLVYALGGVVVATVTSGLPAFWHVSEWWSEPIVYPVSDGHSWREGVESARAGDSGTDAED